MRVVVIVVAGVAIAGAGLALLLGALTGDDGGSTRALAAPGHAAPPATGQLGVVLQAGNVVLSYRDVRDAAAARVRATLLGGTPSPALVATGQAVLARRDAGARSRYTARAYDRAQPLRSLADPALPTFVDRWLGRGAGG